MENIKKVVKLADDRNNDIKNGVKLVGKSLFKSSINNLDSKASN
jgi:hypothetical protein